MGYIRLKQSQIEFLRWIYECKINGLQTIEATRIRGALQDGVYASGGKRCITFNELRDYYLIEYTQYIKNENIKS